MNEPVRRKLCEIIAENGPGVADDPLRCAGLLRAACPEDGTGVDALLRALDARVPARLALLTEPLASGPLTTSLVQRLVSEHGLSESAARWAVDSWAEALGKSDGSTKQAPVEHTLVQPKRSSTRLLLGVLAVLVIAAGLGAWYWLRQSAEESRISGLESVSMMALSADEKRVLVLCSDNNLRLFDLESKNEVERERLSFAPWSVALSPDTTRVLSGAGSVNRQGDVWVPVNCNVRLHNLITGQQKILWPTLSWSSIWDNEPPVPIRDVAFSSDGRLALWAGGSWDYRITRPPADKEIPMIGCEIHIWDLQTNREVVRLAGHKKQVNCAAFSPDGRRVISGSSDGTVRGWDVASGKQLWQAELPGRPIVLCVAIAPDGRTALSGDNAPTVRLWDMETGDQLFEATKHSGGVNAVAFSADGKRALSGGDDFVVRLWNLEQGTEVRHFSGHTGRVTGVAFLPGDRGLSASEDGTLRIWRVGR
jgi:WD40 repeat protein